MVQILEVVPTFGEEFGRAVGQGAAKISPLWNHARKCVNWRKKMKEVYQATGIRLKSTNPKMREIELTQGLKSKYKEQQQEGDFARRLKLIDQAKGGNFQQQMSPQLNQGQQSPIEDMQQPKSAEKGMPQEEDPFALAEMYALLGEKDLSNVALQRGKSKIRAKELSPEFKRQQTISTEQSKADVKFNQELQESSKQHELKRQTLDRLEQLNKKGVTGKPYEKLLEKSGLVALTSEGRREFPADVKNLITDIRSILGAQFTGFEFQTILNAYPSADFSQEANAAIIRNLKDFQDIKEYEVKVANQLKKENGGKLPEDFQSKVNERVHEYAQSKLPQIKDNMNKIMREEYNISPGNILMFDPNGEPLNVPSSDVEKYLNLGATL